MSTVGILFYTHIHFHSVEKSTTYTDTHVDDIVDIYNFVTYAQRKHVPFIFDLRMEI